jgi:hypothetical protein
LSECSNSRYPAVEQLLNFGGGGGMEPDGDLRPIEETPRRSHRTVLCVLILVVAVAGFGLTVGTGHVDSAMLFVGLPTLLALAIALSPPARSVHGVTFKAISLALLLAAVLLHEGAICVLLAAPLVYACGHLVVALVQASSRRTYVVVPVALALGLEGLIPGLRIQPDQSVTATHAVALSPAGTAARIARGPDFGGTPAPALLAALPEPAHAGGGGLDVGDEWAFHFTGDSHGPGGTLVTQVTADQIGPAGGRVEFRRVSDTSVVARWLDWTTAELDWHAVPGGTAVTMTLHFTRGLDPSWYFGPIEQAMIGAVADHFLDAMGLVDR